MDLKDSELIKIEGGATLNASWLNALARAGSLIFTFGQAVGSFVRSRVTGNYC